MNDSEFYVVHNVVKLVRFNRAVVKVARSNGGGGAQGTGDGGVDGGGEFDTFYA